VSAALHAAQVDVAHIQHAPDLFGEDDRLPNLLERLADRGIGTVVTLHTVHGERLDRILLRRAKIANFHRALGKIADRLVVHHHEGAADRLVAHGVPREKIVVIPHGTATPEHRDPREARARLGLPADAFVFTFFGFIHRLKNVHTVVEAFLRIAHKHPNAVLLVAGMPWGDRWYNHLYVNSMKARISLARQTQRALIRSTYLAPEVVPDIYAASDVILLPHRQQYGSASGVFHQAIGGGRPVLVARGPKFADAQRLFASLPELCVAAGDVGAWASAMEHVLVEPDLLRRGREAVQTFAEETAWPRIAARHSQIYAQIASGTASGRPD
jgi:glycosyltransferase involved in cell wall biosynthesis